MRMENKMYNRLLFIICGLGVVALIFLAATAIIYALPELANYVL